MLIFAFRRLRCLPPMLPPRDTRCPRLLAADTLMLTPLDYLSPQMMRGT